MSPLIRLRNQTFITYRTITKLTNLINKVSNSNILNSQTDILSSGLMRDDLLMKDNSQQDGDKKDQVDIIEKLFSEDQEYKMKLANQYDMLSFVGSDIDEVKMDHLTFFKIFHQKWGVADQGNGDLPFDFILEKDTRLSSLLDPYEGNKVPLGLLGFSVPCNQINHVKCLAFCDELRQNFRDLFAESYKLQ